MGDVNETPKQRRERKLHEQAEAREESLKRILSLSRRTNLTSHPWGGGLVFGESGATRMGHIAGFIHGLYTAGGAMSSLEQLAAAGGEPLGNPRELAIHLAVSIDSKLTYLAQYGGEREFLVEGDAEAWEAWRSDPDLPRPDVQTVKVPAYKVLLYDDGTFGGFGVLWHRPYTTEQIHVKAREYDGASYQGREADGTLIPDAEQQRRWQAALDKAHEALKLCKELEETRLWTPTWVTKKRAEIKAAHEDHDEEWQHKCDECPSTRHLGPAYCFMSYGFAFNGGLLLHGMGHPTFAVKIGGSAGPGWSIHT